MPDPTPPDDALLPEDVPDTPLLDWFTPPELAGFVKHLSPRHRRFIEQFAAEKSLTPVEALLRAISLLEIAHERGRQGWLLGFALTEKYLETVILGL